MFFIQEVLTSHLTNVAFKRHTI